MPKRTLGDASITIEAPAAHVWAILTDFDAYDTWNPFTPRIDGRVEVGQLITLHVTMFGGITTRERVMLYDEAAYTLGWALSAPEWWLAALRRQTVEPLGEGRCRYHSREDISGLIMWPVLWTSRRPVHKGFEAVAQALKQQAESTFGG